ncbi:gamma-glutamylcyclotransferase [Hippea alviniae]|uniref:gamma-glutamylcyclotransferase n=1 Tax=Hippea alviniae TaxID=1279027 RepID=UPI0003B49B36|nr:gamma-glutamylcyclotransferase [Hippea alviniae]
MRIKLFFYGTLMKGMRLHKYVNGELIGYAILENSQLYDVGWYPALVKDSYMTFGEIYEIEVKELNVIDKIEDYQEDNPDSLYLRECVKLRNLNGKIEDAYCYFYNKTEELNQPIEICDYRRYILERNNDYIWLASYGSNMSLERIKRRVGEIEEYKPVYIENFKLTFNKMADKSFQTYANIVFEKDARCPAVLQKLSFEQLNKLDSYEGAPNHYLRVTVPVILEDSQRIIAEVYIAHPDKLTDNQNPQPNYIEHIYKGYREFGFDVKLIEEALRSKP